MKKSVMLMALSAVSAVAFAHGPAADHAAEAMPAPMGGHGMAQMHDQMHAGIGHPGDPSVVTRTIELVMDDDMRFTPAEVTVKAGETVRFFVKNRGQLVHTLMIGTMAQLQTHVAMMQGMPAMPHAAPNILALKAGKRGGIVWQFDQAGTVDFGCVTPGHLDAGMVGKITVTE